MAGTVIVTGLDQIQRDLAKSGAKVEAAMKTGLREAAEPTAKVAEELSLTRIRRMRRSPEWAETRTGVTRHAVYVVPKKRGTRVHSSRSRGALIKGGGLAPLLQGRGFNPALAAGAGIAESAINRLLGEVIR